MTNKEIFHRNFRKLIEHNGISQNAFADAIGEKRSTVNMWAIGGSMPRADKIQKIADYFGVKTDDLLIDSPDILIKTDLSITIDALEGLNAEQLAKVRDYIQFIKYEGSKK